MRRRLMQNNFLDVIVSNATFEFKMSLWTKSIPAESTSKFDPDYAFAMRRREGKKSFEKGLLHYSKKKKFWISAHAIFRSKAYPWSLDFIKKVSCLEKTQF